MKIQSPHRMHIACLIALVAACSPHENQKPQYRTSPVIESVVWDWSTLVRLAPGSDLWPLTWASDGNVYTAWGDGAGFGATDWDEQWGDERVSLGFARIEGTPTTLTATNIWGGKRSQNRATFGGKVSGLLSVDGVLYAWVNEQNGDPPDVSLAWSSDLGATWHKVGWRFPPGSFQPGTFLNYGKDYATARDHYVYVYNWGVGSNIALGRVPKDKLRERSAYEFLVGLDQTGRPVWTLSIDEIKPILEARRGFQSAASVVFIPPINRYLMTVSTGGVGQLGMFDAPEPWGPWTTVAFYDRWGEFDRGEALIYSFPTKWISDDGKTIWLVFSAWKSPDNVLDSFNVLKATLTLKNQPVDSTRANPPEILKASR